MCQNSCIPGCHVVYLYLKPRMISKNKKETFKPKVKQIIYNQNATYVYKTSNSTRHLVPTETQRFPDRFSFGFR